MDCPCPVVLFSFFFSSGAQVGANNIGKFQLSESRAGPWYPIKTDPLKFIHFHSLSWRYETWRQFGRFLLQFCSESLPHSHTMDEVIFFYFSEQCSIKWNILRQILDIFHFQIPALTFTGSNLLTATQRSLSEPQSYVKILVPFRPNSNGRKCQVSNCLKKKCFPSSRFELGPCERTKRKPV